MVICQVERDICGDRKIEKQFLRLMAKVILASIFRGDFRKYVVMGDTAKLQAMRPCAYLYTQFPGNTTTTVFCQVVHGCF